MRVWVWVIAEKRLELDSSESESCGWRPFVEGISQSLDALLNAGYEIFEEIWSKSEDKGCYRP